MTQQKTQFLAITAKGKKMKKFTTMTLAFVGLATVAQAATIIIDGTGPGYTNNGSFESGVSWGVGFNVLSNQLKNDSPTASDGSYNAVIGEGHGQLLNTGYNVQLGDKFDLSFDWLPKSGWDDTKELRWRLFTTTNNDTTVGSDNTIIAIGVEKGFSNGDGYQSVNLLSIGTVAAADEGQDLWIEFSTNTSNFARFDQVNLSVTSIPEPSASALLSLGGFALILRRRR